MATTRGTFEPHLDSLTGLHWAGILAAIISGVIHLFLAASFLPSGLGVAFLLAGLGFLGAVVLVVLDVRRRAVYAVGIAFTAAQLVLWYYLNFAAGPKPFPGEIGTIGAVDKVIQIALIVVLVALLARE